MPTEYQPGTDDEGNDINNVLKWSKMSKWNEIDSRHNKMFREKRPSIVIISQISISGEQAYFNHVSVERRNIMLGEISDGVVA